jgi:hypothetical protein
MLRAFAQTNTLHSMIKSLFQFLIFVSPFFGAAQGPFNPQRVNDTVTIYKCSYSVITNEDSTYYKINGKTVPKTEFEKIVKGLEEQKKCHPCILKQINLDGRLDSQGTFYYTCPGSDEKSEIRTKGKNNATISIHTNSCKDGEWTFYNEDGTVKEIKYFDHGAETTSPSKHRP